MFRSVRIGVVCAVILAVSLPAVAQQGRQGGDFAGSRDYRGCADNVIKRLRIRPDSVIVDIGAGDGWWASKMAAKLGDKGVVHAGEVEQKKVDAMKKKWTDVKQIKPYLCPTDGTGMEANSCDMVFLSKTYHHLDKDGHQEYLRHLVEVVKPTGKLVIIERHASLASGRAADHGYKLGLLAQEAEQAGWMLLKAELIPGCDHFMATFVQPEAFAKAMAKRAEAAKKRSATEKK